MLYSKAMAVLQLKVIPASSKTAFAGTVNGRVKLKVAAAPEDGKANAALTAFLADYFGVAKKEVQITSGEKSHLKTVLLPSACDAQVDSLLNQCGT
ncbi:MAG: hypothetical protein Ta2A_20880 [Treponemataceae bacterium]|nr:MAG: hypothetical protein Ta2A_20880 [Treponemataceae bacterium]